VLCRKHGATVINFEDLPDGDWVRVKPRLCSWRNGFDVARPVMDSNGIVTTCCLKTHAYGGVFTMALKLSVGMTRKRNMAELHTSFLSMRKMIAEINAAYRPALVLLDGIEAFTDGGPARGTRKRADVLLAGTDRIAIDAVGLAILKDLGSNRNIYGHEDIRSGADQPRRRAGARRRPSGEHRTRDRRRGQQGVCRTSARDPQPGMNRASKGR
jgi:uncharacterized protein (DUF362 family)